MEKLENKICLDSDFLIDLMKGKKEEVEFIAGNRENAVMATTCMNIFELYEGIHKSPHPQKNIEAVETVTEGLEILELDKNIAARAGELSARLEKKGRMIGFKDILIGAIAKENGYAFKTKNKKHFGMIEGLRLI